MNMMAYKGFAARIEFDAEDELLIGRIAGINDIITFHADTAQELKEAFHDAVDGYVAVCEKIGKEPERGYSGKLMLRVKPELHQQLALASELSGISINQLGEAAIAKFVLPAALPPSSDEEARARLVRQIADQAERTAQSLAAYTSDLRAGRNENSGDKLQASSG